MQTPEELLRGWGLTDRPWEFDSSIHSWRCEHPDRYGECSCFQELVQELAARDEAIRADERAELERLRTGIKALIVEYDDPEDDSMRSPDYYWGLSIASSDLTALLNPTEGEN